MWPLGFRGRRNRELEEEIHAHLTMAVRNRMEQGDTPHAAELAARREFGNRTLVQEVARARAKMSILYQWTIEDEFKTNDDRSVRDWKMEVQPAGAGLSHLRD